MLDGAGRVAVGVEVGAAHVDEHEVLPAIAHRVVDVPAIGLEAERALEMQQRGGAVGGGGFDDGGGHASPCLLTGRSGFGPTTSYPCKPTHAPGATVTFR